MADEWDDNINIVICNKLQGVRDFYHSTHSTEVTTQIQLNPLNKYCNTLPCQISNNQNTFTTKIRIYRNYDNSIAVTQFNYILLGNICLWTLMKSDIIYSCEYCASG